MRAKPLFGSPIYPANGYPPRPGEDRPGLSPFGRLALGQTLGKSSILIYDRHSREIQRPSVDMVQIEGDDLDAQQLTLTLHPPRVIPLPFEDVLARFDGQNLTGEQTNAQITAENFPGTDRHMRWPPLEALIEFGTGGVSTSIIVDYMNGITLTVQASYMRAHALVTQTKEGADIYGTSAAYYLAAHVGPGFAESHTQRTIFLGELDDGEESAVLDVPRFAKVATLIGCRDDNGLPPVIPAGWIRFSQSPNGDHCVSDAMIATPDVRVEVPNTGQYFRIINQSGRRMRLSVIFELAL